MSQTIHLHTIKCLAEINEASASEEPYVIVTTVNLRPPGPGIPAIPNLRTFRYGVFEDVDAGEVRAGGGVPFWGLNSTPEDLQSPEHLAAIVSLLENDNADPGQYQSFVQAAATISITATLGESDSSIRAARLLDDIRRALNGVDLPFPFALDDDHIGSERLTLDPSDLLTSGIKDKTLTIQSSEGQYELVFRVSAFQPEWRFCGKCKTLFFDGDPNHKGICPVGSSHQSIGLNFALLHDVPPMADQQAEWRFCRKCMTLFFDGDPANKGACPGGLGHESIGFNFALLHDVPSPPNHQPEWRFCGKCMSLFFNGEPNKGVCARPAPSAHEAIGNNFFLPFNSPGPNRQPDWRFCGKCMTLFFDGDPNPAIKGKCPVGGGHQSIGNNFFLPFDSPGPNRQPDWRFCGKCMTLFFDGDPNPAIKGACPAGGGHQSIGNNFFLPFNSPGPNMQPEWRFCGKCMSLFFNGAPNKGVCARPAPSSHEAIGSNFLLSHT